MRLRTRSTRRARARAAVGVVALLSGVAAIPIVGSLAEADGAPVAPYRGMYKTQRELLALPTSGGAWEAMKDVADGSLGKGRLDDQDSTHDTATLGAALVYARSGIDAYRTKAAAAISSAIGTDGGNDLATSRNASGYVIAADLINLPDLDPALNERFEAWLEELHPVLVDVHERRANNWGTSAGAGRIAIDVYLGDTADLTKAAAVFRGWAGDRSAYSGHEFGDLCWQADPKAPVGINPKGAKIGSVDVDGALPDDMRRGSCSVKDDPASTGYPWGALEGAAVQAQLLSRQGHAAWTWSDQAMGRALDYLDRIGWTPDNNSRNVPWIINANTGRDFPTTSTSMGIVTGFADWVFGPGGTGNEPPVAPPPTEATTTTLVRPTTTLQPPTLTPTVPTDPLTPTVPPAVPPIVDGEITFEAVEDAFVRSDQPRQNLGNKSYVRVKSGSNHVKSYLKFDLSGLEGRTVTAARLVLDVRDSSDDGGRVLASSNDWSEGALTYDNAPATGEALTSAFLSPSAGDEATYTFLESGLATVSGDGVVTLVIDDSESSDSAWFSSREDGSPARLVLTLAPPEPAP